MRNQQLNILLHSLAYDRGHSAGMDEVDTIYNELCEHFKEIDDQLPCTMPPKFKVGDKVYCYPLTSDAIVIKQPIVAKHGHYYEIDINGIGTLSFYECDLKLI